MNDHDPINFEKWSVHATPEESPGYLLWRISVQWRAALENILKPIGLTHPQFVVLASLGWETRKGGKVSQAEVGRTAGLDPNTTSQILRGLETKKLIKRAHSSDERSKNPTLTIQGSQVLARALPAVEKADAHFFAPLQHKESKMLLQAFQKLITQ